MQLHFFFCRGDRIRTCDPLVPNQVRYQLRHAPRTDFSQQDKLAFTSNTPVNVSLSYCRRGDRIRTCDPLVPNQVRYQLRHAPKTFFHLQRTVFLNRRANLVLFFYKSNKMSVKMQNRLIIYKKPIKKNCFL